MTTTVLPTGYIPGQMTIERLPGGRFKLEGNWALGPTQGSDHFQLLYEALEITAASDDKFKVTFKAMLDEYMTLTYDWDETPSP
jgi:hypothetical protein